MAADPTDGYNVIYKYNLCNHQLLFSEGLQYRPTVVSNGNSSYPNKIPKEKSQQRGSCSSINTFPVARLGPSVTASISWRIWVLEKHPSSAWRRNSSHGASELREFLPHLPRILSTSLFLHLGKVKVMFDYSFPELAKSTNKMSHCPAGLLTKT